MLEQELTKLWKEIQIIGFNLLSVSPVRLGNEERSNVLVPAPAVRLMKRRVSSRPGVDSGTSLVIQKIEQKE